MMKEMNKLTSILIWVALLLPVLSMAQVPAPAGPQEKPVAIMNATAHLGNGEVIPNAIITFKDGKLENVVDATVVRMDLQGYEQINASGMHAYPGLILPCTDLGLVEIAAVSATVDNDETGPVNPNVRSIVAYNTDSHVIPTNRFNGILMAQIIPKGGLISGTSSVVQLDAWNWEDAAYKTDDGIHLNWPSRMLSPRWWMGETDMRPNDKYGEQVKSVTDLLEDARSYAELSRPEEVNLKLEAMRGLFDGSKQLFIHADKARDMMESVQQTRAYGVKKQVLVGAEDAHLIIDFLKENNVPVILKDVHRMADRNADAYDLPYQQPAILHKAGVLVTLMYENYSNARNLPFYAGTTAGNGLSKEEALQLVTLNAAKVLGIDATCGSLESGKDATLVLSSGDILDMRSNNIVHAFIMGRKVTTEGKQQYLYNKWKTKYGQD